MTISPTSIGLSWTQPASGGSVGSYTIVSRVTGSGAFALLLTGLNATSYEVTGLTPTTSYDFGVFGVNAAGPGPMSVVTQATQGEVPNAPTGLSASAGTPAYADVALSWTAPGTDPTNGPASSYTVQQSPHGLNTWTAAASGATATGYTVTGLSHDTAYDFRVIGVNSAGSGAASGTATLTTDYAPPNAPTISSVAPVPDGSDTKLTVAWTAPATDGTHDAATGYNLRHSVHAANTWTTVTGVTSPYTITMLSSGTAYDVEVQATNASTTSPGAWSAISTATTYSSLWTVYTVGDASPTTVTHGTGGIAYVISASVNPNGGAGYGVNFSWSTSNTTNTVVGGITLNANNAGGYPFNTDDWGQYLTVPSTTDTYYVWAIAVDGTGGLVIGPITVT